MRRRIHKLCPSVVSHVRELREVRAAMLSSTCAPRGAEYLNGSWTRVTRCQLRSRFHNVEDANIVMYWCDGMWIIEHTVLKTILAFTMSDALHPNTLVDSTWTILTDVVLNTIVDTDELVFYVSHEILSKTSKKRPLSMDDIGLDFFTTWMCSRGFWVRDPTTRQVVFSGAKGFKGDMSTGRRYCPFPECKGKAFSANNFVSQHMKNVHPYCAKPRPYAMVNVNRKCTRRVR